ncbi:ABC transporter ATP-binding protein [Sulfolobales archaeon HS-7]|nr:ABC transporter ATP-binding protein [Sulfolobales archaeon HS-7]
MSEINTALSVEDLSVVYRTQGVDIAALKDITFNVNDGEIFGIIGESGSGKSTLAKAILRNIKPPGFITGEPRIFCYGRNIISMSQREFREKILWQLISYVPQSSLNSLNGTMRIIDHFYDTATSHGISKEKIREKALELLKMVRLEPEKVAVMYPHQLSGGMRQRVLIALSLLLNPKLVIMDEAVSALDVATQKHILDIIKDLNKSMGITVIFITHDIAIAAYLTHTIMVLYAGEIMEIGKTERIIKSPYHPYSVSLMSSVPSIRGSLEGVRVVKEGYPSRVGCPFNTRCEYTSDICFKNHPELYEINSDYVRCFNYATNKPKGS